MTGSRWLSSGLWPPRGLTSGSSAGRLHGAGHSFTSLLFQNFLGRLRKSVLPHEFSNSFVLLEILLSSKLESLTKIGDFSGKCGCPDRLERRRKDGLRQSPREKPGKALERHA